MPETATIRDVTDSLVEQSLEVGCSGANARLIGTDAQATTSSQASNEGPRRSTTWGSTACRRTGASSRGISRDVLMPAGPALPKGGSRWMRLRVYLRATMRVVDCEPYSSGNSKGATAAVTRCGCQ